MEEYDGLAVTPHRLVAEGETVVALGRYTATHRAGGKPLNAQFAHEWTLRDGRVVEFQQYTDTAQYQQLRRAAT